ncbi:MAG: AI-2E family transporter [Clostridia bacterium]|nr:AI-2E family transporter [Clostridia bacterium]MBQ7090500.1 AI-2E family transporter [Clostridia bacterium]
MKLRFTKEQRSWGLLAFSVVAAGALFIALLLHLAEIWSGIRFILGLLVPFYIGFAIAYILNPIVNFWEDRVFSKIKKPQQRRNLALLVTFAIFLLLITGVLIYLLPRLINSLTRLINEIPNYYKSFTANATDFIEERPQIAALYERYATEIHNGVEQFFKSLSGYLSGLLPTLAGFTLKLGGYLINTLVGIIISVYMLHEKERLIAQLKKVLNSVCRNEERYEQILRIGQVTHEKTLSYMIGRLLDSLIVAVLSYLVFLIMGVPYAMLCAITIGLCNTIPYFGSWIGAIPPAIVILIAKPILLIPYFIFIIVFEQIDGNIIGPKIQSKQVGLSALWIIFALFLFGGLFGFLGMLLGVPAFAVIYYFINAAVNNSLHRQGKSANTVDYATPEDREIIEDGNEN